WLPSQPARERPVESTGSARPASSSERGREPASTAYAATIAAMTAAITAPNPTTRSWNTSLPNIRSKTSDPASIDSMSSRNAPYIAPMTRFAADHPRAPPRCRRHAKPTGVCSARPARLLPGLAAHSPAPMSRREFRWAAMAVVSAVNAPAERREPGETVARDVAYGPDQVREAHRRQGRSDRSPGALVELSRHRREAGEGHADGDVSRAVQPGAAPVDALGADRA